MPSHSRCRKLAIGLGRRSQPYSRPRGFEPVGVSTWAIGVTTSPRIHPTLDLCLDSIVQAGWARPQLFIDGPVRIADRHASLPATCRSERVGAWPNYYLALAELMLRQPRSDAFVLVQDDAVFYNHESLPRYLERRLVAVPRAVPRLAV